MVETALKEGCTISVAEMEAGFPPGVGLYDPHIGTHLTCGIPTADHPEVIPGGRLRVITAPTSLRAPGYALLILPPGTPLEAPPEFGYAGAAAEA